MPNIQEKNEKVENVRVLINYKVFHRILKVVIISKTFVSRKVTVYCRFKEEVIRIPKMYARPRRYGSFSSVK